MGKSKNKKSRNLKKEEKERIRSIFNKQKEINITNNASKNFISVKNLNNNLEKIINKKIKKHQILKSKVEEKVEESNLNINKPMKNLFEVKNYENENIQNFEKNENLEENKATIIDNEDFEIIKNNPFRGEINELKYNKLNENVDIGTFDDHLIPYLNVSQDIIKKIEKFMPKKIKFNFNIKKEIIEFRKNLPIAKKELEIVDSINNNLVTIISGSTGSGKSTQIPQYLIERGINGKIGVTQPRKLAATGVANRTSQELNRKLGDFVGYQVRFDSNFSNKDTKIKFMTDGILLREMMSDFLLIEYEYIIIDEAHERKVNTDLLLGLWSRIVNIRANLALNTECKNCIPLKLIIMSATLRINDFTENKKLFSQKINVINIEQKVFDIKIYQNKTTPDSEDIYSDIVNKVKKIHVKLPPGGILIFLTGKEEIKHVCNLLNEELKVLKRLKKEVLDEKDLAEENEDFDLDNIKIEEEKDELNFENDYIILPLFSKLSIQDQNKIYENHSNKRIIVVSTNIAETSLTIPNIKYLIDSGKEKIKYVDHKTGIIKYNIDWISQSSANQRSGRVGRVSNGYVYRLYTVAVYGKMKQFSEPEILKMPLDRIVLQLMSLGIKNVFNFPYPSIPNKESFEIAYKNLVNLKAIDKLDENYFINNLGKILSFVPLEPKLSKILFQGNKYKIIGYTFLLCGVFLAEDIFEYDSNLFEKKNFSENNENLTAKEIKKKNREYKSKNIKKLKESKEYINNLYKDFIDCNSDFVTLINILGNLFKFIYNSNSDNEKNLVNFCKNYSLNIKNIKEIYKLINQISSIMNYIITEYDLRDYWNNFFSNYTKPDDKQINIINEIIVSSKINNVVQKLEIENNDIKKTIYRTQLIDEEVKIFPFTFTDKKQDFFIFNNIIKIKGQYFCFMIHFIDNLSLISKYDDYEHKKDLVKNPLGVYNANNDTMMGFYKTYFGKKLWELPHFLENINYNDDKPLYIKFLFYNLLKGKVIKEFKAFKKLYLFSIKNITYEYWDSTLFKKIILFLLSNNINNKEKITQCIKTKEFIELFILLIKKNNQKKIETYLSNFN